MYIHRVYTIGMENIIKKQTRHKRIIFEVSDKLYEEVKKRCGIRGINMRMYITRAILEQIKKEKKYE